MSRRRFSREDWVTLGLEALSAGGPEAVKLEAICAAAGLTRGSFYHHFADHEGYLTSLATSWFEAQTAGIAATVDPDAAPRVQGAALTEAVMEIDYRLELGMRELGRRFARIDEIVKRADALRLHVLGTLYERRYGLDPETAEALAYIEYAAFSGIILLDPDTPRHRQKALADLFEQTLDRALGGEGRR